MSSAKNPIIIVGQQILSQNNQHSNAYDLVKYISQKFGTQLNVLHSNASQVAAFDLGFRPDSQLRLDDNGEPAVVWLFGVDDSRITIPKNCFLIYQVFNNYY